MVTASQQIVLVAALKSPTLLRMTHQIFKYHWTVTSGYESKLGCRVVTHCFRYRERQARSRLIPRYLGMGIPGRVPQLPVLAYLGRLGSNSPHFLTVMYQRIFPLDPQKTCTLGPAEPLDKP